MQSENTVFSASWLLAHYLECARKECRLRREGVGENLTQKYFEWAKAKQPVGERGREVALNKEDSERDWLHENQRRGAFQKREILLQHSRELNQIKNEIQPLDINVREWGGFYM